MISRSSYTIRGYHCDAYGHLNNARYLELFEDARWNLLDEAGIVKPLSDKGLLFFVVSITVNYKLPVNDGSRIRIETWLRSVGKRKMVFAQRILSEGEERICTDAEISFVLYDTKSGKAANLTEDITDLFKDYYHGTD